MIKWMGILETATLMRKHLEQQQGQANAKGLNKTIPLENRMNDQHSEITVYHNAVKNLILKRNSSLSEDNAINTSDETDPGAHELIDRFIADQRRAKGPATDGAQIDDQQSSTSGVQRSSDGDGSVEVAEGQPKLDRVDKLIQQAELAKARIFNPPGKGLYEQFSHVCAVTTDENYMHLTAHVDETIQQKIEKGEYVDLGKLIPRDRVIQEEDNRMQLVLKDAKSYWVLIVEQTSINSYVKWEKAFRVYADIYSRANPFQATKLIEYSHIIHTILRSYSWDCVYLYDKDFRLHMARNPLRNWLVILQQAWSLCLRDQNRYNFHAPHNNSNNRPQSHKDICCRYNAGRCTYGLRCKYEHRCSYCLKLGHVEINCRKKAADSHESYRPIRQESGQGQSYHGHQSPKRNLGANRSHNYNSNNSNSNTNGNNSM